MRDVGAAAGARTGPAKKFVRHPLIERYITKYSEMLGLPDSARPKVAITKSLSTNYLARARWFASHPREFFLEFVDHVTNGDPRALEGIVAHEMVHVVNMRDDIEKIPNPVDPATGRASSDLIRLMRTSDGHGKDFLDLAARINAQEGENFVTVTSDMLRKGHAGESKPYYVYLVKVGARPAMVAWAAKLPKNTSSIREKIVEGVGAFVRTTDPFFTSFTGKIDERGRAQLVYSGNSTSQARLEEEYLKARRRNAENPNELRAMLEVSEVAPYYLLIDGNPLSYAWSDDNPHLSALTVRVISKGAVVVQTTDPRWRANRRAKIGSLLVLRMAYPTAAERPELARLLVTAPEVLSPFRVAVDTTPSDQDYYLLISKNERGGVRAPFSYGWSLEDPSMFSKVYDALGRGYRLVRVDEPRWRANPSCKIERMGYLTMCLSDGDLEARMLEGLWNRAGSD